MRLYLPQKYVIVEGNGVNTGFCTCWSDPKILVQTKPELEKLFALIGTLYSKEGTSIIIRNLALNPQINKIYIWGNNPLSKTPFGSAGREAILELWKNGIHHENNLIKGSDYKLHKEISANVVDVILKNVELVDVSHMTLDEVISLVKTEAAANQQTHTTYMGPVDFPEAKFEANKPMPSEETGWSVRGRTVHEAWFWVVDRILRYGIPRDKVEGQPYKELQVIQWVIENEDPDDPSIPGWPQNILKTCGLDKAAIEDYKKTLLNPHLPEGTSYTYGQRLLNYDQGINQIRYIIDNLRKDPAHRNAVATTLFPKVDLPAKQRPCLVFIQFLNTEEGKLNLFATFRAHEVFKSAIPNAFGLLALHKYVCDQVNIPRGKLVITSNCAYVYMSDLKDAGDLLKCKRWESINTRFDETSETDPRGIVRIKLINGAINLELTNLLSGEVLIDITGQTAREIVMKLAKLNLLVFPSHYADISIELVKAEIALKKGIFFEQDNKVTIESGVEIN